MQITYLNAPVCKHTLQLGLDCVVVPRAEWLPVGGIPEKGPITMMWDDVVYQRGPAPDADREAPDAPWPTPKEFPRHPFPAPIVATIVCVGPVTI
jgi:hypothetical protein